MCAHELEGLMLLLVHVKEENNLRKKTTQQSLARVTHEHEISLKGIILDPASKLVIKSFATNYRMYLIT